jgi:predicted permease
MTGSTRENSTAGGWGRLGIERFSQDLRYALRVLRRSPVFTAVAVLSLGIGIGANTAIFGIVDNLLLKKLPVPDPDGLVLVDSDTRIDHAYFLKLRELTSSFSSVSEIWTIDRSNLVIDPRAGGGRDAGQARIGLASANYFSTFGANPIVGRSFMPEEDRFPGGRPVVVISDDFWRRHFARAPDIVGHTLRLNSLTYDIVGVAPPRFTGEWVGMPTDLWVPFSLASAVMPEVPGGPDRFPRRVIARLKPGVTIAQARTATEILYRQILTDAAGSQATRELLDGIAGTRVDLEPAARGYSPQRRAFGQPLAILTAAVAVLLLTACANLANLLLARSAARQREVLVRLAIGASRGRLVRQMLTESRVLSAAGGIAGGVIATWAGRILATMVAAAPVNLGGQGTGLFLDVHFDVRVLLFMIVVCAITTLLFGLVPALSASRVSLSGSLTDASTRVVGVERFGPSTLLVTAQIALSLLLLVGAGLFLRTLTNLRAKDLGIERQRELLVWTVPGQTGRQGDAIADLWHTVQLRLSALPGVVKAAASNQAVLRGVDVQPGQGAFPMRVEGDPPKMATAGGFRSFVTPGFFDALGVPIIAGRDFTERDTDTAPPVAIINESMARFYFGDRSPVGRMVRFTGPNAPLTEIIGVTRDFVRGTPRGDIRAEFATYFPYRDREAINRGAQSRLRIMLIAIRAAVPPLTLADSIRRELYAIDPELPVLRINTTEQQLDDVLSQDRLIAVLSAAFATMAVPLACLGLFGLISYAVARRTNEIGVRLALGATPRRIIGMILSESGRLVAFGIAVGVGAAVALVRLVSSRLYGVSGTDPLTIAASAALLILVAAIAALIPARRASRVDPMVALRSE